MLCSNDWQFVSDVSGETIIPTFKGQEVQEPLLMEWQAVPKCWKLSTLQSILEKW